MAYVASQNKQTAGPTGTENEGPVQLGQGSVVGASESGGVVDAPQSNRPSQSTPGAGNFSRYTSLLKPQSEKLANDFVSSVSDKNSNRLSKELNTARTNFNRDRTGNTRAFNQGTVDTALRDAQSSESLANMRKTGYLGPGGLDKVGISNALQRAAADRQRLGSVSGRKEMLTRTQGITPGMSALDSFLMQGQGDIFGAADFDTRLTGEANAAYGTAEQQAAAAAAQNVSTAQQTEEALGTGTRGYLTQLQNEQSVADAARQRVISGGGSAGDLSQVGLTPDQIAQLRSGLAGGNAARTNRPAAPPPAPPVVAPPPAPTKPWVWDPTNFFGYQNMQAKPAPAPPPPPAPGMSEADLISRISSGSVSSRGLVNDFVQQRFGGNPNASKMQNKYSDLRSVQGVIDNLINPNLTTNKIDTGFQSLAAGNRGMGDFIGRSGVTQAESDRLDALEKLYGQDVGNIGVTGAGTDFNAANSGVGKYAADRARQYQGQIDQQQQSIMRALNQARADRSAGAAGGGTNYRRFDG